MGADFMSMQMVVRDGSPLGQIIDRNRAVTAAELEPVLAADPGLIDEQGWDSLYHLVDEADDCEPHQPTLRHWAMICERVLNAAVDLWGRDCGRDELGQGLVEYDSGGLSWGDWPTTACELMYDISDLPACVLEFAGATFVDPRRAAFDTLGRIDWEQLAAQRETLVDAQEHETDQATSEALLGVSNLLDALDDFAVQHLRRPDSTALQAAQARR